MTSSRKPSVQAIWNGTVIAESDDTVRGNIPPELVALFDRVKSRIKGSDRMSRTEAFLHYAEEHEGEVLQSIEDKTDAMLRELEAQARKARRGIRKAPAPPRPAAYAVEAAPTATDWSREMSRLRESKPRPLHKRYGPHPTDEQNSAHRAEEREWNRLYRKASKEQKRTLADENQEYRKRAAGGGAVPF